MPAFRDRKTDTDMERSFTPLEQAIVTVLQQGHFVTSGQLRPLVKIDFPSAYGNGLGFARTLTRLVKRRIVERVNEPLSKTGRFRVPRPKRYSMHESVDGFWYVTRIEKYGSLTVVCDKMTKAQAYVCESVLNKLDSDTERFGGLIR